MLVFDMATSFRQESIQPPQNQFQYYQHNYDPSKCIILFFQHFHHYLQLKDLLAVAQGTVLELDRSVGDLLDIKVNDAVIAKGEVVAISQNKLGVRILEIVSPMERARKLK